MTMTPSGRALRSLRGLSIGDAFGEMYVWSFRGLDGREEVPLGRWPWTDDTHMALSIVEVLLQHQKIEQDALANAFARRFLQEPYRGYAGGAYRLLGDIARGGDWRQLTPALFPGGSYGNGGAMRASPIGAYMLGEPERAREEAIRSAVVTHAHPEGQAGAVAVAVAAALTQTNMRGHDFIRAVAEWIPPGLTRERAEEAASIPADRHDDAVDRLGVGIDTSAQDTVPYCLWCAAHHLDDFEEAIRCTARGLGDCDTTCAIVGGIVALSSDRIPELWIARAEPLPREFAAG
jgi:ADP-ribosylglycohydrolase